MAKDPGFIFYPGDYLRDTQNLSEKAQVAYDRIMCEHMRNICIRQEQVNFFTKRLNEDEKAELMFILTKVEGGFQIEWVALSINKRKAYSKSRSENRTGKKGDKISSSYVPHMENENENEIVIKKEKEKGNCLMKNSGVTIQMVAQAFKNTTDLINADPKYYFDIALDWSANGHMKKDWLATIRGFARRDIKDGKLKLSSHKQHSGTNLTSGDKLPEDYGTIRPGTVSREEYLKTKDKT